MTAALPINAVKRSRSENPGKSVTHAQINMPNAVLAVSSSIGGCSTALTTVYSTCSSERQIVLFRYSVRLKACRSWLQPLSAASCALICG